MTKTKPAVKIGRTRNGRTRIDLKGKVAADVIGIAKKEGISTDTAINGLLEHGVAKRKQRTIEITLTAEQYDALGACAFAYGNGNLEEHARKWVLAGLDWDLGEIGTDLRQSLKDCA